MTNIKIMFMIIFAILAGTAISTNLIMDAHNPIQSIYPNSIDSYRIDVRFSFPSTSQGLYYKQYIALEFPKVLGSDLQFDLSGAARYSCELTDGTIKYTMAADKPLSSENHIAYCRFDDRVNNLLKTGSKINYKFSVQLVVAKITSTNFIRNLRLFTSTVNKPEKMIIDQGIRVGTMYQSPNWETATPKPLDLSSSSILIGSTVQANIYPYQNFDVTLNLKSSIFMSISDINIVFRYPSDLVSGPQSITSAAILASDPLQAALKGTLTLSSFGSNAVVINGIDENLIPNRQFQVTLKGWRALDLLTNQPKPLEILVFYKNTYSVISYQKTSGNLFRISSTNIKLTYVDHPEGWDIWRNALWPMRYAFSFDNDLSNGGYVLIQHTNAQDSANKWNFVASTCDFSENDTSIENSFAKRPICYPLRTDFEYPSSSTSYAASGIFFKLGAVSANKTYYVTVWGSADNCGGNAKTNMSNVLYANDSYKQFQFKATLYATINAREKNEDRFINQQILAESSSTLMGKKCFNNVPRAYDFATTAKISAAIQDKIFPLTFLNTNSIVGANLNASNLHDITNDVTLFQEIYNFNLINETSNSTTCSTCHLKDITSVSNLFAEAFIYGAIQVSTSSYFALKHDISIAINSNPIEYLALPYIFVNNSGVAAAVNAVKADFTSNSKLDFTGANKFFGLIDALYTAMNTYNGTGNDLNSDAVVTAYTNTKATTTGAMGDNGVLTRMQITKGLLDTANNTTNCANKHCKYFADNAVTAYNTLKSSYDIIIGDGYFTTTGGIKDTNSCGGLVSTHTSNSAAKITACWNSVQKLQKYKDDILSPALTNFETKLTELDNSVINPNSNSLKFSYNVAQLPGRAQFLFSKNWFSIGDVDTSNKAKCLISWGYKAASATSTEIQLINDVASTVNSEDKKNFMLINNDTASTISSSVIDTNNGCLPLPNQTNSCATYKIVSLHQTLSFYPVSTRKMQFAIQSGILNETGAGTGSLYFYSTCLKWARPAIKSLYTYIDFQVQWLYETDSTKVGLPARNIRYIKLFPESGVFNDNTGAGNGTKILASGRTVAADKPYRLHFVTGSKAVSTGVCLIEIWGKTLAELTDQTSTTLGLWLGMGVILETDYTDLGATYPVAPLASTSMTSYGLQSGYFFNLKDNLLLNNAFYVNTNTSDALSASFLPFRNLQLYYTKFGKAADVSANSLPLTLLDNKSSYIFLMGSVVLIQGVNGNSKITQTVGSETYARPMMIPIYCPLKDANSYFYENGFPTLYMAYMTMSGWSTITSVNRILSIDLSNSRYGVVVSPQFSEVTIGAATNNYRAAADLADPKSINLTASDYNSVLMTLRWAAYTSTATNADSTLYLYQGTRGANGNGAICTAHIFMLNNSLEVDSTKLAFTSGTTSNNVSFYNSTKKFYFLGVEFTKAIFVGLGSGSSWGTVPTSTNISSVTSANVQLETSQIYLVGVKRPTLESFYSNGTFTTLFNKIGYFCSNVTGVGTTSRENLTNYLYNANSSIKGFFVDYSAPTTSTKTFTGSIVADKGDIFKNDLAANLKLSLTTPSSVKIPGGSSIKFWVSGNVFTSNTICGLVGTSGKPVIECSNTSNLVTCVPDTSDATYNICCYNFSLSGLGSSDNLTLSSLYVTFPAYPDNLDSNYYSLTVFNEETPSKFSWGTGNSQNTQDYTQVFGKVSKVEYQQVTQETGIGKAIFTLSLPREPVRNMVLTFSGDLLEMNILNTVPRCIASLGSTFNLNSDVTGDALIESCQVNGLSTSTSSIVINTRNIVYTCGQSFSKTLTIMLWPVVTVNWSVTPFSTNNYIISMKMNNSDISLNTKGVTIQAVMNYQKKPLVTNQWDTLCAVSSVIPKIPGEYAEYVFDFDLDTGKTFLTTAPNEATIFFPYSHYGGIIDDVLCFYSGTLVNCSFSDEGILNIRFSSTLPVGTGKKIQISVVGIQNPSYDSDIYFPCTMNSTNFSTGIRYNVITGSGKLSGGIPFPTTSTNLGNLRFMNIKDPVSDLNPRNTSTHIFRITFDTFSGLSTLPITISNTPQIIITFPNDYKLAWFNNIKASATIDEYTSNDTTNVVTKTKTINSKSITQSGNNVIITLEDASLTINSTWRYWDLKISNIVNPLNNSVSGTALTTGSYSIILTNTNYSSIFRVHSNSNNFVGSPLSTSIDSNLAFNRGLEFKFDNNKWVVDVNATGTINTLSLNAGRFSTSTFSIKSNPNISILPRSAIISLTDQTFKTSLASYDISTSTYQSVSFMIGAPCGNAPGTYLVNFSINDTSNFAPLAPILITLENTSKANISYVQPPSIPAGGSTLIYFKLSEPNVDQLILNFAASDTAKNDSTATLNSVTIPATQSSTSSNFSSTFSIKNSSITNSQIFKATDPNSCFTWSNSEITFTISGKTAIIPNNLDLISSFKYFNSETDSTLKEKNSIKFIFTPPVAPIYMDCALVCSGQNFPSDDNIRNKVGTQSTLLKFYSDIFTSTSATAEIVFNNLVRGQKYKLRCIIQSTQGDVTQRTFSSATLDNYKMSNATVDIMPVLSQKTQCAQFLFSTDPGQTTRIAIVNYCQKVFSSGSGWSSNGCIICTDSSMTYTPPGLSLPSNLTCVATASKAKLRFLQNTATPATTTNSTAPTQTAAGSTVAPATVIVGNPITYSVCPVPHPVCPTDATGNKNYQDYFSQLITDLKTPQLFVTNLNIQNVPVNGTLTVSDSDVPDVSKLQITIVTSNVNGVVEWNLRPTTSLNCYWQIAETSSAPTNNQIVSCVDASWCGNIKVTSLGGSVSTSSKTLKAFTAGKSYGVYHACYNDIPRSTTLSGVQSATFNFPSSPNTTPINTNTNTNTTTTPTASSFLSIGYLFLLLIFGLLN